MATVTIACTVIGGIGLDQRDAFGRPIRLNGPVTAVSPGPGMAPINLGINMIGGAIGLTAVDSTVWSTVDRAPRASRHRPGQTNFVKEKQ
jgi:hypothetical protein